MVQTHWNSKTTLFPKHFSKEVVPYQAAFLKFQRESLVVASLSRRGGAGWRGVGVGGGGTEMLLEFSVRDQEC